MRIYASRPSSTDVTLTRIPLPPREHVYKGGRLAFRIAEHQEPIAESRWLESPRRLEQGTRRARFEAARRFCDRHCHHLVIGSRIVEFATVATPACVVRLAR